MSHNFQGAADSVTLEQESGPYRELFFCVHIISRLKNSMGLIFFSGNKLYHGEKGVSRMRIVRGHAQLQNTSLLRVVSGLCRKRAAFNYDVSVTLLGS